MIQDKNFMIRQLKEMSRVLNSLITSYPDNTLGIKPSDISQQIYSATGYSSEDFMLMTDENIAELLSKTPILNHPIYLEFLGNLFYYHYQRTKNKAFLKRAQGFYQDFQSASNTFSLAYFSRIQEQ